MKTIWKYPVQMGDTFTLKMPITARVLDVQIQHGRPVLWALVDTDSPISMRGFKVYATGEEMTNLLPTDEYLGTFQVRELGLVFHLYGSMWV